jgi:hypothetical protein
MTEKERGLGRTLLRSSALFFGALLLAIAAAAFYRAPNTLGAPNSSLWLEPDFLCSLASSALALASAWAAGRRLVRTRAFLRVLLHALTWFGLTVGLFLLWGYYVSLLTLLIAPAHAFAGLRLVLLWQAWRAEVAWRAR